MISVAELSGSWEFLSTYRTGEHKSCVLCRVARLSLVVKLCLVSTEQWAFAAWLINAGSSSHSPAALSHLHTRGQREGGQVLFSHTHTQRPELRLS